MILLVDLCYEKDSLSRYEFVDPIADEVRRTGADYDIMHFMDLSREDAEDYQKLILCGTALKDSVYAEQMASFWWIREIDKPLLGICAGMQVICAVFGGNVVPQKDIGLKKIEIAAETPLLGEPRTIEGYHLHNYGVTLPDDFQIVAGRPDCVEGFKHHQRPIYGILFHPEVRNRWIIEKFVQL